MKAVKWSSAKVAGSRSTSRAKRRKRLTQAKLRSTTQLFGKQNEPVAALRALDHDQAHAPLLRRRCRLLCGVGRIGVVQLDGLACHLLHSLRQGAELLPLGGIGGCHGHCQQRAQGIDHRMDLGATHPRMPIHASARHSPPSSAVCDYPR